MSLLLLDAHVGGAVISADFSSDGTSTALGEGAAFWASMVVMEGTSEVTWLTGSGSTSRSLLGVGT